VKGRLFVLFMPGDFANLYVLVDNTTVKTTDDRAAHCIGNSVRNEESSLEYLLAKLYEACSADDARVAAKGLQGVPWALGVG
jgi:hypothetical protein